MKEGYQKRKMKKLSVDYNIRKVTTIYLSARFVMSIKEKLPADL